MVKIKNESFFLSCVIFEDDVPTDNIGKLIKVFRDIALLHVRSEQVFVHEKDLLSQLSEFIRSESVINEFGR